MEATLFSHPGSSCSSSAAEPEGAEGAEGGEDGAVVMFRCGELGVVGREEEGREEEGCEEESREEFGRRALEEVGLLRDGGGGRRGMATFEVDVDLGGCHFDNTRKW